MGEACVRLGKLVGVDPFSGPNSEQYKVFENCRDEMTRETGTPHVILWISLPTIGGVSVEGAKIEADPLCSAHEYIFQSDAEQCAHALNLITNGKSSHGARKIKEPGLFFDSTFYKVFVKQGKSK